MKSGNLIKRTISGIKWNLISQILASLITISVSIVLMRLLDPSKFGLIGMVMVFIGFLNVFKNMGLGSSIIQRKEISDIDKNSIFWASLGLGFFLSLLLALVSPLIGFFYKDELLSRLTMVLSVNFLISSLSTIHNALLVKSMSFKKIFLVNLIATFIAGVVAILLALKGFGVWSLAVQQITLSIVATTLYFIIYPWLPKIQFSKDILMSHLKYSFPLVGNQIVNYWVRNADNLLIGKLLGDYSLGLYSRSYSLMLLPVSKISGVISQVMFPSLSKIQNDKEKVKQIFFRMTKLIALITFPSMIFLHVSAYQFVSVVLGNSWLGSIYLIKVLSLIGAIQSIGTLVGILFTSQGATKTLFRMNIILGPVLVFFIFIGVNYGLNGVVLWYAIGSLIIFIPQIYVSGRIVNISIVEYFLNLKSVIISTLLFYGALVWSKYYISMIESGSLQLASLVVFGVFTYAIVLKLRHKKEIEVLRHLIKM